MQAFYPGGREGDGLLLIRVVDPEASVVRFRAEPQQRLVLAEDFDGAADCDGAGSRRHVGGAGDRNDAARFQGGDRRGQ